MDLHDIRIELNKQFFQAEKPIDAILLAIHRKKNCILYGPPGHAKSQLVETALKLLLGEEAFYEEVYQTNGGLEMPTSPFIGTLDIKKYQETGQEVYNLEDTVYLANRFAIIEEGLDMPAYAMETMKQPLMSGTICVNGKCHKNRLETLFICTNHNPMAWAGDSDSLKAAIARFPHRAPVMWADYSLNTWVNFFQFKGTPDDYAAQIVAKCHSMGYKVSPRTAVQFQELLAMGGVAALEYYDDMAEHPAVYKALVALSASIPFFKELAAIESLVESAATAVGRNDPAAAGKIGIAKKAIKDLKGIPKDTSFTDRLRTATLALSTLTEAVEQAAAKQVNSPVL